MSDVRLNLPTDRIVAVKRGAVGWIGLNNPARLNAISMSMWSGLIDAAKAMEDDGEIRAVVIYGVGGKAFASGADISEFDRHRSNAEQQKEYGRVAAQARAALTGLSKPLIAMIEGYCIGGGVAVSLLADVRIADEGASFAIPAAKLGIGYDYEGIASLARLVGPSAVKDLFFSARRLSAQEALTIGLVNQVAPAGSLPARTSEYAEQIARNAPLTIQLVKQAVRVFESADQSPDAADLAEVARMVRQCFDSVDYQEGRAAFQQKRAPRFSGR